MATLGEVIEKAGLRFEQSAGQIGGKHSTMWLEVRRSCCDRIAKTYRGDGESPGIASMAANSAFYNDLATGRFDPWPEACDCKEPEQ